MKRLAWLVLLAVSACALPASHSRMASAEPAGHSVGEDLLDLLIVAGFVLVVIPAAAKPWK